MADVDKEIDNFARERKVQGNLVPSQEEMNEIYSSFFLPIYDAIFNAMQSKFQQFFPYTIEKESLSGRPYFNIPFEGSIFCGQLNIPPGGHPIIDFKFLIEQDKYNLSIEISGFGRCRFHHKNYHYGHCLTDAEVNGIVRDFKKTFLKMLKGGAKRPPKN